MRGERHMARQYPCGAPDNCGPGEEYKSEIACTLVGCRGCKYFNGIEYYKADVRKGVGMWARHELEQMGRSTK